MLIRRYFLLFVVLALSPLSGCQQATPGPTADPPTQQGSAKIEFPTIGGEAGALSSNAVPSAAQQVTATAPSPGEERGEGHLIEEIWDAYSMQGVRVGYGHMTIASVVEEGRELIRTRSLIHTSMQRSGQTVAQDMTLTSWDTSRGQLVRFESRLSAGPGEIVSVGAVRDGQLGIDTTTLGRTQSQKIPWQADWGGLFAPEQLLRRQPLKPGEKRTVRSLLPLMNIPADTRLEALDYEPVDLPTGKAKLLKVNNIVDLGAQKIESVVWINEQGDTFKSLVPSIGQEAVRTTKADALRPKNGEKYDLLLASTVRLKRPLTRPHETQRVVYRAHVKSGAIAGLFSDGLSQRVKPLDEQTAELTVLAVRPNQPSDLAGRPPVPPSVEADSAANNFIQSDDQVIAQMASRVATSEADPWKIACGLEKFVDEAVKNKNFSSAFATAAEVARSLEGDCTEHAVLMAALCRARKVPARVAFGLVYYPPEQGFAYHMWNEVWIKDRWVPMDATLALGGIGADHIKLGDSNLAGGSPLADLLSVIQIFGRLELEVLEVE
jgi:transglutaminase superfamily protein